MTFFTADDFEAMDAWRPETLAQHCNAKLAREAKVVYGQVVHGEFLWNHTSEYGDTHRALLICVEEIERKPCEHEPKVYSTRIVCAKCDKEIKPVCWGVVDEQR